MSFTRDEIKLDVFRKMEDSTSVVFTDSDFNQEFNSAIQHLERKIDFRELEVSDLTSLDTVENQREYTLPTTNGRIRKIIDLVIDDTHYRETPFRRRDNYRYIRGVNFGDVRHYSYLYYLFNTTTIGFLPTPTAVKDVEIYYYRYHPAVVDGSTALLFPDAVREALVSRIYATGLKADATIPDMTISAEEANYERLTDEYRESQGQTSQSFSNQFFNH